MHASIKTIIITIAIPKLWILWLLFLHYVYCMFIFAPGRSQHDSIGQRCDKQRRPSFCHRSSAYSGCWSNPETLAGPLRCPHCGGPRGYLPVQATHHSIQWNRLNTRVLVRAGGFCGVVSWWSVLNNFDVNEAASCLCRTVWTSSCPSTITSLNI